MKTCCETVWRDHSSYRCFNNAKYEHEGNPYCGTHYPPNVQARRQKGLDKWKAERDASVAKARQFRIESDIKQCCADGVAECHPDEYANIKRRAEEQPR